MATQGKNTHVPFLEEQGFEWNGNILSQIVGKDVIDIALFKRGFIMFVSHEDKTIVSEIVNYNNDNSVFISTYKTLANNM